MAKHPRERWATAAMWAGLGLTVAATAAPYLDRATLHLLADHIRAGYPGYSQEKIDTAVTAYLMLLTAIGACGAVAWLWTIRAVGRARRWARPAATAMLVLGTCTGLAMLLTRDTSGDTGLPPELAWTGLAPCLAGLATVALLWTRPSRVTR
ncbi:hypothetical protein [Actinomadura sp. 21ATH]|uniref:hypothetical protein n=1 Tax=Actinomadura sp. 21ATH TaxID=1735444 RepID=UPI0035BFC2E8